MSVTDKIGDIILDALIKGIEEKKIEIFGSQNGKIRKSINNEFLSLLVNSLRTLIAKFIIGPYERETPSGPTDFTDYGPARIRNKLRKKQLKTLGFNDD